MIEQEITLLTNGRISFPKCGNGLQFGYTKNRGVYSLKVNTSGEWDGLTIRAFWHIPEVKEPLTSLLVDGVIRVPALVTSYKGEGRIVFEGSDGEKTVTSADVHYYVNKNSGTCDGSLPEPGTPAWQELINVVKGYSETAVEAKDDAKKSADEAKQALEDTKEARNQAIKDINSEKDSSISSIDDKKNSSIDEINAVKEEAKKELSDVCRTTEDFANQAKESAEKAKASELAAKDSETKAKTSEDNAKISENLANQYKEEASDSASSALESKNSASQSESNALESANAAALSEANSKLSETASGNSAKKAFESETNAKASETNASNYAVNANNSATNASASAESAKDSADKAKTSEIVSAANTAEVAKNLETVRDIKSKIDALDENVTANAASASENAEKAKSSADAAKLSETNAKASEDAALISKNDSANNASNAKTSADNAKLSETNSKTSEKKSEEYMASADASANSALDSANKAKQSELNSESSAAKALASENKAKTSEDNAKTSEESALASATSAEESKNAAASSESKAKESEDAAKLSETNSKKSEDASKKSADDAAASLQELKDGIASGDFKGADGFSPTIDVQGISGGHRLTITDINAEKVVDVLNGVDGQPGDATIDDMSVSGKFVWSSQRVIDTLCDPIKDTGNPVVCYPVETYPLGVTVSWEPTQEGTGDPSPDNIRPITGRDNVTVERCGENLLDISKCTAGFTPYGLTTAISGELLTIKGTASTTSDGASFVVVMTPDTSLSGKGYKVTAFPAKGSITNAYGLRTADETAIAVLMPLTEGTAVDVALRIMVSKDTPTAYTPYRGDTTTLALPSTIYGGTVDAVTGEGQKTWRGIDSYAGETLPGEWLSDRDVYAAGTIPTVGAQVVYKLPEPTSFNATGVQPILAISGVNTILTDADTVTVTGRAIPEKNRNQDLTNDILFKYPRTGKIYTTKIPRFSFNPTTTCEKLDDNTGLVCSPSTDTIENQDDYENIPLFKWYNCNYLRDEYGHAYPTAIEGLNDDYKTTGSVDVGVIQMTPYVKWDESNDDYVLLSITDTPKDGFTAWPTAISNGVVYPYTIHSKYISGVASDGLLRSQPNLKPERLQSYNNMIANYAKKGSGYFGAGVERNSWQIIFNLIKYANKSSQANFYGVTNYSFQYDASVQRSEKLTYFPVTKAQAANIVVGNFVSVGYGYISGSSISKDCSYSNVHKYADSAKVLKIEAIEDNNSAVYLDVKDGFDTMPVSLSDTLTSNVFITSMHWYSGSTDSVKSHHDGSAVSNSNGKYPYRIQGIEYMVGGYTVASDVVTVFDDQNGKDIYVSPKSSKRVSDTSGIISKYTNVGNIPSGDSWIGDIGFDVDTGATWVKTKGSSNATGVADYILGGGSASKNTTREYLQGGNLGHVTRAGSSCLALWAWLGGGYWDCLSAD